nr:MOSC domain-containing protein [Glycomyces amatae]
MLVVFAASVRRLGEERGGEVAVERFRPNVLVEADLEPYAEAALAPGTPIRLGGHGFTVDMACERCVLPSWTPDGSNVRDKDLHKHIVKELGNLFGIYVRTGGAARIAVGDPVAG